MKIKRTIILLVTLPLFYLVTAVIWAGVYTVELVHHYDNTSEVTLSKEQRKILLSVEDPTFDDHFGVDLSPGQGLTTISSAVAAQVFYKGKRLSGLGGVFQAVYSSVFSCCKRIDFGRDLMAIIMNAKIEKSVQLQIYLKTVYMGDFEGRQCIGFNDASLAYYGEPIEKLSITQFIGLVAIPLSPNQYHPLKNPDKHRARVSKIELLVSGACSPNGWFDVEYEKCGL